jgi:photosystem II stability/assembly factor-like uncharacterized protein
MRSIRTSMIVTLAALVALLAFPVPEAAAQQVDLSRLATMEARAIGPAAMSGRVAAIEGVPGDHDVLYVGSATGGVWKSTDSGTTWEPIFDDQDASSIGAIRVHPANPDLVWVGTGEGNMRNSSGVGRGVWRTLDGGESWTHVGLEETEHVHRIAVHPSDPDIAYVAATGSLWSDGGQRGLYRTTDRGESWELVLEGSNARTGAVEVVIDPRNPLKLFASLWEFRRWPHFFESGGPGSGLHVSHDGGDTWEEVSDGDAWPSGDLGRIGLDVSPADPDVVYALTEAERTVLMRSDDGGETWSEINRDRGLGDRPMYYGDLMADPGSADRVYHIAGNLRLSTDGGRSFEGAATWGGGVHVDFHALWISPEDPDFVVTGNDGGVYISRDGADTWRFVENLPLAQFYEIDVDMDRPYNVYGGLQDNGSWRGPSEVWEQGGIRNYHWTEIGFGDGFGALDDPEDPRYGFSMSQQGNLNRYDLVTGNRRSIRPDPPEGTATELRFNWNSPIAVDPHRENTIYYGSQFVHRSTDDGMSWDVISHDLTTDNPEWQRQEESGGLTYDVTGAENYTTVYTIAVSPVEEGIIWAGTDDGHVQVTRDGGETWTNVVDNIPGLPDNPWVSHIEASKYDAGTAFAVVHNYMKGDGSTYVYRTTDFGGSWTALAPDQVDGFARTLEQDPVVEDLLYLGTEFGLYVSLDGGGSWQKWTHGVPTVPVRALTVHPRDHDLVLGTHGRGAIVLDDVRPLRALSRDPGLLDRDVVHMFEAGPAYEHETAAPQVYRFTGSAMFSAPNPPYGATIRYLAPAPEPEEGEETDDTSEEADEEEAGGGGPPWMQQGGGSGGDHDGPVLEIVDADSVIQTLNLEPEEDGLSEVTWNLRREGFRSPDDEEIVAEDDRSSFGPEVLPGTYTLRLATDADTVTQELEVRADPRVDIPMSERRAKFEALMEMGAYSEVATEAVNRILMARRSIDWVTEVASAQREADGADTAALDQLEEAAGELEDRLVELQETWVGPLEEVQGIRRTDDDVMSALGQASGSLGSSKDAPTPALRPYMQIGIERLEGALQETNEVFDAEVSTFREQVREAGLQFFHEHDPLTMPDA